ncbi:MAG: NADH-quinone oxidoreductase subunit C [Gammaproteobacteria bacterium]
MATPNIDQFSSQLKQRFAERIDHYEVCTNQIILEVSASNLIEVATALRDEAPFEFEQLMDLSGVDYSTYGQDDWQTQEATSSGFSRGVTTHEAADGFEPKQYAVVYQLLSLKNNQRLRLRVFVEDKSLILPSVVSIWNSADWYEREAFDLFGILFDGHPDLRRILTDYGFIGHPFRKDFPLEGNVEVRYDEEKGRVIYQPVTIESRVLVPRVIRKDDQLSDEEEQDQDHA